MSQSSEIEKLAEAYIKNSPGECFYCMAIQDAYEDGYKDCLKSEKITKLVNALKFYANCPSNSGMIEGIVNNGEYMPLGSLAKEVLAEFEGKK